MTDPRSLLSDLLRAANAAGADAADAVLFESTSLGVSWRMGKLEDVERSESRDLGLRVFIGRRQAVVSTTDVTAKALAQLAERGAAMAKLAPEDPYCGLAPAELLAKDWPDLDLVDPQEPSAERLIGLARDAEGAALAVDGITNSEGAGAGFSRSSKLLATSHGFMGGYSGTTHSVSCSVLAGEGTAMERDYDFESATHGGDLGDAQAVGRSAALRTLQRLNPRKMKSQTVPVVFDPRVSMSLLGHFAGAISGPSVARGTSFLKDRMGQQVFSAAITAIDDPHRVRGKRSRPFDGEGVANRKTELAENGVLKSWLLDSASARQLKLAPTGHAARGTGGPPGPSSTNLYIAPGAQSPGQLMAGIAQGLYVTELIGMGVNGVTGDYSRGAAGFWIENGQIAFPVSEITIAGNLKDMFLRLTPANDLTFKYGVNAPTLLVESMTVAGA